MNTGCNINAGSISMMQLLTWLQFYCTSNKNTNKYDLYIFEKEDLKTQL